MTERSAHVHVEDADGIRTITIDRPESKNALTAAMRAALVECATEAEADPSVKVVILTAVDPVFSAGVDFKEPVDEGRSPLEQHLRANPGAALRAMTTPVICAVNGACVSGALEIALSCSFIIASERARFADTHARLNVVPAWGLTALLPRAVGIRKAREMSITGNFVDASEALRIGLVNAVCRHGELRARARAVAEDVADQPAVREILRLYARGEGLSLTESLAMETDWVARRPVDREAFRALGEQAAKRARGAV